MSGDNRRQIVLKGGKGGLGNQHFATATMQVPKYAQPGQPAMELEVNLELKVIADVGLDRISKCRKIHLPFQSHKCTAEDCQLPLHNTESKSWSGRPGGSKGICRCRYPGTDRRSFGRCRTGHEFLRHIERTKVIIHVWMQLLQKAVIRWMIFTRSMKNSKPIIREWQLCRR